MLRATVDELNDPRFEAPTRALTAEGVVDPQLGARFVERLLEPRLRLYAQRLTAAREAGQMRPDVDPRVALELFVGPLTHRWLLRTRPLTHAYADELVEYALRGIAPADPGAWAASRGTAAEHRAYPNEIRQPGPRAAPPEGGGRPRSGGPGHPRRRMVGRWRGPQGLVAGVRG